MRALRQDIGFTLIELAVVLAVVVILGTMGWTYMSHFIASSRVSNTMNSFNAALRFARAEAVRRNTVVTMCRSADPFADLPQCNNAPSSNFSKNDWASGWVVFVKASSSGNHGLIEDGDAVLWREQPSAPTSSARVSMTSNLNSQRFSFHGDGTRAGNSLGATFTVDHRVPTQESGDGLRCMTVSLTGRIRTYEPNENSCKAS